MAGSPHDLFIIGAGPAGLFAAIHAARSGRRVCILEKNDTAGAKLLLTGAGKCNLTHSGTREEFLAHYGMATKGRFVKPSLYSFTSSDLCRFFEERGVPVIVTDGGKVFPRSLKSHDIVRVLVEECLRKGVEIRYGEPVESVERTSVGFSIVSGERRYEAGSLVIASGGKSYPQTGSTGKGYVFARHLGHTVVTPAPALSPVTVREYRFSCCSGISVSGARITLSRSGKKIMGTLGDVLFTHHGLSGPGILDLSRYIEPEDTISLSLFPFELHKDFGDRLAVELARNAGKTLKNYLKTCGIPERLFVTAVVNAGIPLNSPCSSVDKKTRFRLEGCLVEQPFVVERVNGFDQAMITKGGVALCEVKSDTLESRVVPSLYFAGEVLDVDGDTGGFNLQFAFSSGWLVGKNVSR